MRFTEFMSWLEEDNKAQFIYNGRYYDFVFNRSRDGSDFYYAVLFHGCRAYDSWRFTTIHPNGPSKEEERAAYLDFIKKIVIEGIPIRKILEEGLYKPGSLRMIKGTLSKDYHRNTNTIAELFIYNLYTMDASAYYKDCYFGFWGSIRGDFDCARKEDYYDLYFDLGHDIEKKEKVSDERCSFETKESICVYFEDLDPFYTYLYKIKLDGLFLSEILEKELFDDVDMAI